MDILEKLIDLHKQATEERSHNYMAETCREAMNEIAKLRTELARSRDANAPDTATLAEKNFVAMERLRALEMMNVPTDYEERKAAAVKMAEAEAAAVRAKLALDRAITNPS